MILMFGAVIIILVTICIIVIILVRHSMFPLTVSEQLCRGHDDGHGEQQHQVEVEAGHH